MKMSKCLLWLMGVLLPVSGLAVALTTLDQAPINIRDVESLQRGAQIFTNYCLSCHSARAVRYNRLMDLGLSKTQIQDNLIFTNHKIGDMMVAAMRPKDAQAWFGAPPPDLSVVARARGADWLYTYMRSFYRDPQRPSGWNNVLFNAVAMPHVLWQWQGDVDLVNQDGEAELKLPSLRRWQTVEAVADGTNKTVTHRLVLRKQGQFTRINDSEVDSVEFDQKIADLVNYLVWMGEPSRVNREHIGYGVLLFLVFLLVPLTFLLKREYWKDVH